MTVIVGKWVGEVQAMRRVQPTPVTDSADRETETSAQTNRVRLDQIEQERPHTATWGATQDQYSDEQLQELVDALLALESERDDALVGHAKGSYVIDFGTYDDYMVGGPASRRAGVRKRNWPYATVRRMLSTTPVLTLCDQPMFVPALEIRYSHVLLTYVAPLHPS